MRTFTKKIAVMITATAIIIGAEIKAQGLKGDKDKKKDKSEKSDRAQGEKCFDENTHIINLGVGFGGGNYYRGSYGGYSDRRSPAFSLSYEQSLKKRIGPGYLGVGAYGGFQTARYHYDYDDNNRRYYYEHKYNHTMIAARGAYHWDVLNSKKAEVYAGAIIGMRIQTYSFATNDPDPDYNYRLNEGIAYPAYSLFAGARWYFVDRVALFGEAGYGISYLTGGLSFKF